MAVSYVQVYWLLQFSLNLSSFHHFQETFSNIMNSEVNCRSESSSLDLEKSPKVCLFQFSTLRCFLFQFDCSNFINTVVHHRIYFMQMSRRRNIPQQKGIRRLQREFNISCRQAQKKILGIVVKSNGGQTVFSADEENNIVELLLTCADLGVPFKTTF